jgi:hypothetical protein
MGSTYTPVTNRNVDVWAASHDADTGRGRIDGGGGHIEDGSRPAGLHDAQPGLATKQRAFDVDVEGSIDLFTGHLVEAAVAADAGDTVDCRLPRTGPWPPIGPGWSATPWLSWWPSRGLLPKTPPIWSRSLRTPRGHLDHGPSARRRWLVRIEVTPGP